MAKFDSQAAIECYARFITRYAAWLLPFILLLVALLGAGVQKLVFEDDWRIYFSQDNPERIALEELEQAYTKSDNVLFVVTPKQGDVFTPDSLESISALTEQAWQLPYSQRVDSLTNFQYIHAEEDDLIVEDLFTDISAMSDQEIERRREVALEEPRLVNRILSTNGGTTGIVVTFELPESNTDATEEVAFAARELVTNFETAHSEIGITLSGELMLDIAFREAAISDMSTLVPLMYLVIVIVLLVLLRSVLATISVLFLVTTVLGTSMGLAGWLGIPITTVSIAAPTMIMTLAMADSIHIVVSMQGYAGQTTNRNEAIERSLRINFVPVMITSLTTMVGFLTLNFNEVPPFRDFGNITAFGVVIAFLLSITLLPCVLKIMPISATGGRSKFAKTAMSSLANFVIHRRRILTKVILVASVALIAVIPQNKANNQFIQFFGQEIEFRRASDYTIKNLTGIYTIDYSLPARGSNGIVEPSYIIKLDEFSTWLREQPEVAHVRTLSDTLKKLNKSLNFDKSEEYRLPENRELAAQYLLLYELSLPYGLDLNSEINVDKSATRVQVTLSDISQQEIMSLKARSENWLRENAPESFTYGVGPTVMFADIFERSTRSMIGGALLGLVLISLLLIIALRSTRHGLLSLVPNLLPIGVAFGVWAIIAGEVNMGVSLVITMTLGIVVDDTVHFLSKYLHGRRKMEFDSSDSIRFAFNATGFALLTTTTALACGFLVMSMSSFSPNADSALLTAIALVIALTIDFLFLPPLLLALDHSDRRTE